MNIGSRLMLAGTAVGLLSGSLWIALIPHLIWQYLLLMGSTSIFGTALFVVTDPDTPEMKERREYEKKEQERLDELVAKKLKLQAEASRKESFAKPLNMLEQASLLVIDPKITKKLKEIIKVCRHINDYAIDNSLEDKLIVWNSIYITNITKLVNEYNTVYDISHQTNSIKNKIKEFEDEILEQVFSKVERQYEELLSGKINSFDIDLTLVREISNQ